MTVSATDNPAVVVVSENGAPGVSGENGTDGQGFNNVRKALIDNPLCWLYAQNNIVRVLNQLLTVSRTTSGSYTDIYGNSETATDDTPREELSGWLINGDELHQFNVFNNVPLINGDFSVVMHIGGYSENTASQGMLTVPGIGGDLLKIGTDASGNWLVTIRGSDNVEYEATTVVSATSAARQSIVVTYTSGVLNLYIDGSLSGTVTLPTGSAGSMDLDEQTSIAGDFDLNIQGLRFYDFVINNDEIEYLD